VKNRLTGLITGFLVAALILSVFSCSILPVQNTSPTTTTTSPASPTIIPTTGAVTTSIDEVPVVKIIDGDTIDVNIGGVTKRVRYIGVDTPERDTPFYQVATETNSGLVAGKNVRLVKDTRETDDYGRLLRYVYVGEIFVNARLVELGYAQAFPYPPDTKYNDLFATLEQTAKSKYLGIWSLKYTGNKSSKKYHLPTCTYARQISAENYIGFQSAVAALTAGYTPCGVCKPPTSD